jgi:hypothetical protein
MVSSLPLQRHYGTAKPCSSFGRESFITSMWNMEIKIIRRCATVFPWQLLGVTLQVKSNKWKDHDILEMFSNLARWYPNAFRMTFSKWPQSIYKPTFISTLYVLCLVYVMTLCKVKIDTDMSYTRVLHIKVAYRIPHKWCHAFYVTRPLLCARITCYVTVITHGRWYARA